MAKKSPTFINLFTDFGFKRVFGTEENKDLLMNFLNVLLDRKQYPILDIQFLNVEALGKTQEEKKFFMTNSRFCMWKCQNL